MVAAHVGARHVGLSKLAAPMLPPGAEDRVRPEQCFAKCPFTCQLDRLSDELCRSLDRLSGQFAKHCGRPNNPSLKPERPDPRARCAPRHAPPLAWSDPAQ